MNESRITRITLPNGFTRTIVPVECQAEYDRDLVKRASEAARYLNDPNTMPSKEVS